MGLRSQVMLIATIAVAGFIVVATIHLIGEDHLEEVLASQTAKAIEDISKQIADMQSATQLAGRGNRRGRPRKPRRN